jgi:glutamine amidotransferase
MQIGLIDYGRGNLHSVNKALQSLGAKVELLTDDKKFNTQDALILPGVGAFGDAMRNLTQRNLATPIREWIQAGKPFLGICLGYQLLFDQSDETPGVSGLGLIKGRVIRFPATVRKIPHMGWNKITTTQTGEPLLNGITNPYFYHVHSYYPIIDNPAQIACWTDYAGVRFASGITTGNLAAFQFHPEKSQHNGLRLIENFLRRLSVNGLLPKSMFMQKLKI